MTTPVLELGDDVPTALYRLYDAGGQLLYVGITKDLKMRFTTHAALKPWWPEVIRRTIELHAERDEAAEAELRAIRSEGPLHNIAGVGSGFFGIDEGDLPKRVHAEDVIELVMLKMSPQALRLALLELVGMPTGAALDMIGCPRTNKYRVINQREAALGPRSRLSAA